MRRKNWLVIQRTEIFFAQRPAMVQLGRYFPATFHGRNNQKSIHRPMMILTQRYAIGRMIVSTFSERNEMSAIDEGEPGIAGGRP